MADKNIKPVDEMTSRDFQNDLKAHLISITNSAADRAVNDIFGSVIYENVHLFSGSVVLNLDCGLGLLALFAAKAGAKRVYAVDTSNAIDYLDRIVEANNFSEVVYPIKKPLRDLELPEKTVDIILCNWLGPSMLYQSVCVDVIYARDKWLNKETGIIMPDVAKLYVAGIEDKKYRRDNIDWWRNVYGFEMNLMRTYSIQEPIQMSMAPTNLITSEDVVKRLDLKTATLHNLKVHCDFTMEACRSGKLDGIVTYFEVQFTQTHKPASFRTCPESPQTSYLQSVYFFDMPILVKRKQLVYGRITMMTANPNKCDLNNMRVTLEMYNEKQFTSDTAIIKPCAWVLHPGPIDWVGAEETVVPPIIPMPNAGERGDCEDMDVEPIKDAKPTTQGPKKSHKTDKA